MKRIVLIILAAALLFAVTACGGVDLPETSDEDNEIIEEDGDGPDVEKLQPIEFSVKYKLLLLSGSCIVLIDETGLLTKDIEDANGNILSTTEKSLSESEAQGLAGIIAENRFFKLPERMDGKDDITDQVSRSITVTYNGESYERKGYGTDNKRFLAICRFIERLAEVEIDRGFVS